MKRKAKAKTKVTRVAKDLPALKTAKGGNVSTYTVTSHIRRIYSKTG